MATSGFLKKGSHLFLAIALVCQVLAPVPGYALGEALLPPAGRMVFASAAFTPLLMRGVMVSPENPFEFQFLMDSGDSGLAGEALKEEGQGLIKYFLAALTTPDEDLWVNLSPYEGNRIMPQEFGQTLMGRDMLAQDYLLKQLAATLICPERELGQRFWDRVYTEAQRRYHTTDIPFNTFNKVWVLPDYADVYERDGAAYILDSHLKIMLEEDYAASQQARADRPPGAAGDVSDPEPAAQDPDDLMQRVMRELILPEIEREVNAGKNFAKLRQVYHAMILATWYKERLRDSLLNRVYADQKKTAGVDVADKQIKEKIYQQYLAAFKQGVYHLIREEYDPAQGTVIPRKYFSGGAAWTGLGKQLRYHAALPTVSSAIPTADFILQARVDAAPATSSPVRAAEIADAVSVGGENQPGKEPAARPIVPLSDQARQWLAAFSPDDVDQAFGILHPPAGFNPELGNYRIQGRFLLQWDTNKFQVVDRESGLLVMQRFLYQEFVGEYPIRDDHWNRRHYLGSYSIRAVDLLANQQWVLVRIGDEASGRGYIYDIRTGEPLPGLFGAVGGQGAPRIQHVSADRRWVVLRPVESKTVLVLDALSGRNLADVHGEGVIDFAASPDGQRLVFAYQGNRFKIYDVQGQRWLGQIILPEGSRYSEPALISGQELLVLTAAQDRRRHIFDYQTGEDISSQFGAEGRFIWVRVTENVFFVEDTKQIRIFDTKTLGLVYQQRRPIGAKLSPSGRFLSVESSGKALRMIDLSVSAGAGEFKSLTLATDPRRSVGAVDYSPAEGYLIVTYPMSHGGVDRLQVFDTRTGEDVSGILSERDFQEITFSDNDAMVSIPGQDMIDLQKKASLSYLIGDLVKRKHTLSSDGGKIIFQVKGKEFYLLDLERLGKNKMWGALLAEDDRYAYFVTQWLLPLVDEGIIETPLDFQQALAFFVDLRRNILAQVRDDQRRAQLFAVLRHNQIMRVIQPRHGDPFNFVVFARGLIDQYPQSAAESIRQLLTAIEQGLISPQLTASEQQAILSFMEERGRFDQLAYRAYLNAARYAPTAEDTVRQLYDEALGLAEREYSSHNNYGEMVQEQHAKVWRGRHPQDQTFPLELEYFLDEEISPDHLRRWLEWLADNDAVFPGLRRLLLKDGRWDQDLFDRFWQEADRLRATSTDDSLILKMGVRLRLLLAEHLWESGDEVQTRTLLTEAAGQIRSLTRPEDRLSISMNLAESWHRNGDRVGVQAALYQARDALRQIRQGGGDSTGFRGYLREQLAQPMARVIEQALDYDPDLAGEMLTEMDLPISYEQSLRERMVRRQLAQGERSRSDMEAQIYDQLMGPSLFRALLDLYGAEPDPREKARLLRSAREAADDYFRSQQELADWADPVAKEALAGFMAYRYAADLPEGVAERAFPDSLGGYFLARELLTREDPAAAEQMIQELPWTGIHAMFFADLAEYYSRTGQPQAANTAMRRALDVLDVINNDFSQAILSGYIAQRQARMGQFSAARDTWARALTSAGKVSGGDSLFTLDAPKMVLTLAKIASTEFFAHHDESLSDMSDRARVANRYVGYWAKGMRFGMDSSFMELASLAIGTPQIEQDLVGVNLRAWHWAKQNLPINSAYSQIYNEYLGTFNGPAFTPKEFDQFLFEAITKKIQSWPPDTRPAVIYKYLEQSVRPLIDDPVLSQSKADLVARILANAPGSLQSGIHDLFQDLLRAVNQNPAATGQVLTRLFSVLNTEDANKTNKYVYHLLGTIGRQTLWQLRYDKGTLNQILDFLDQTEYAPYATIILPQWIEGSGALGRFMMNSALNDPDWELLTRIIDRTIRALDQDLLRRVLPGFLRQVADWFIEHPSEQISPRLARHIFNKIRFLDPDERGGLLEDFIQLVLGQLTEHPDRLAAFQQEGVPYLWLREVQEKLGDRAVARLVAFSLAAMVGSALDGNEARARNMVYEFVNQFYAAPVLHSDFVTGPVAMSGGRAGNRNTIELLPKPADAGPEYRPRFRVRKTFDPEGLDDPARGLGFTSERNQLPILADIHQLLGLPGRGLRFMESRPLSNDVIYEADYTLFLHSTYRVRDFLSKEQIIAGLQETLWLATAQLFNLWQRGKVHTSVSRLMHAARNGDNRPFMYFSYDTVMTLASGQMAGHEFFSMMGLGDRPEDMSEEEYKEMAYRYGRLVNGMWIRAMGDYMGLDSNIRFLLGLVDAEHIVDTDKNEPVRFWASLFELVINFVYAGYANGLNAEEIWSIFAGLQMERGGEIGPVFADRAAFMKLITAFLSNPKEIGFMHFDEVMRYNEHDLAPNQFDLPSRIFLDDAHDYPIRWTQPVKAIRELSAQEMAAVLADLRAGTGANNGGGMTAEYARPGDQNKILLPGSEDFRAFVARLRPAEQRLIKRMTPGDAEILEKPYDRVRQDILAGAARQKKFNPRLLSVSAMVDRDNAVAVVQGRDNPVSSSPVAESGLRDQDQDLLIALSSRNKAVVDEALRRLDTFKDPRRIHALVLQALELRGLTVRMNHAASRIEISDAVHERSPAVGMLDLTVTGDRQLTFSAHVDILNKRQRIIPLAFRLLATDDVFIKKFGGWNMQVALGSGDLLGAWLRSGYFNAAYEPSGQHGYYTLRGVFPSWGRSLAIPGIGTESAGAIPEPVVSSPHTREEGIAEVQVVENILQAIDGQEILSGDGTRRYSLISDHQPGAQGEQFVDISLADGAGHVYALGRLAITKNRVQVLRLDRPAILAAQAAEELDIKITNLLGAALPAGVFLDWAPIYAARHRPQSLEALQAQLAELNPEVREEIASQSARTSPEAMKDQLIQAVFQQELTRRRGHPFFEKFYSTVQHLNVLRYRLGRIIGEVPDAGERAQLRSEAAYLVDTEPSKRKYLVFSEGDRLEYYFAVYGEGITSPVLNSIQGYVEDVARFYARHRTDFPPAAQDDFERFVADLQARYQQLRQLPVGLESVGQQNPASPGGIDLNPANLNLRIRRDDRGRPLPWEAQPFRDIQIEGLTPVIINIIPIINLPLLLSAGGGDAFRQLSALN